LQTRPGPPSAARLAEPKPDFEAQLGMARAALCLAARKLTQAHNVEDLVQDALARALAFRATYDPTRPLLPWLRRILVHLHFDRLRARRLPTTEALDHQAASEPEPPAFESAEQLRFLLAQLDEPGRTLLARFHQQGDSIECLSQAFDMPAGTIKSHLHRARRQLAERFTLGPGATLERRSQ
jgi:RNA polymerase sigma-70 factor, ECF subfamily